VFFVIDSTTMPLKFSLLLVHLPDVIFNRRLGNQEYQSQPTFQSPTAKPTLTAAENAKFWSKHIQSSKGEMEIKSRSCPWQLNGAGRDTIYLNSNSNEAKK
jgi:hypothetical protein